MIPECLWFFRFSRFCVDFDRLLVPSGFGDGASLKALGSTYRPSASCIVGRFGFLSLVLANRTDRLKLYDGVVQTWLRTSTTSENQSFVLRLISRKLRYVQVDSELGGRIHLFGFIQADVRARLMSVDGPVQEAGPDGATSSRPRPIRCSVGAASALGIRTTKSSFPAFGGTFR